VTCIGETFASRVAASLLINAGMHELVTESFEAYEQLVLQLAESPEKIGRLRDKLEAGRNSCALFDLPRGVKNLEHAYEVIFESYAGKNPARVPRRA
jgi:predicted O-linked N-acetylglucosamine transferase (SPINDLY family)